MVGRTAGVLVLTGALLTGCLSSGSCAGVLGPEPAAASCADAVEYDGEIYLAWAPKLPVAKGEPLGDAVYPPCNDTGCDADELGDGTPTQVWTLRGVDPSEVIVGELEGGRQWIVYGQPGVDPKDYFRLTDGEWRLRQPSR